VYGCTHGLAGVQIEHMIAIRIRLNATSGDIDPKQIEGANGLVDAFIDAMFSRA